MKKKILITGASGLLGQNIIKLIELNNYEIRVLIREKSQAHYFSEKVECFVGDIRNADDVLNAAKDCDYVFHTCSTHKYKLTNNELYSTNYMGTINICDAVEKNNCSRLIYTSAISTLNSDDIYEIKYQENLPKRKLMTVSKLNAEKEVLKRINNGLPAVILNPTYFIGPLDFNPSPIRLWIPYILSSKRVFVPSGGFNLAGVSIVAQKHLWALKEGEIGIRYPIYGVDITYFEYVKIINQLIGKFDDPIIINNKILKYFSIGKVFDKYVVDKLSKKSFYNSVNEPDTNIEEIKKDIDLTIKWFSQNSKLINKHHLIKYLFSYYV